MYVWINGQVIEKPLNPSKELIEEINNPDPEYVRKRDEYIQQISSSGVFNVIESTGTVKVNQKK